MFIIVSKYLIPKGYRGITMFPFIILKSKFLKKDLQIVNHEKIHIRQQLELLIIPFFILYFFEFIFRYFKHNNWNEAYRNISFEKEAYQNENDFNYLKKRKLFQFVNYF
jgi:hypothetical protein